MRADLKGEVVEPKRVERRLRGLNRIAERIGNTALTAATNDGTSRNLELLATLN